MMVRRQRLGPNAESVAKEVNPLVAEFYRWAESIVQRFPVGCTTHRLVLEGAMKYGRILADLRHRLQMAESELERLEADLQIDQPAREPCSLGKSSPPARGKSRAGPRRTELSLERERVIEELVRRGFPALQIRRALEERNLARLDDGRPLSNRYLWQLTHRARRKLGKRRR